jgi:hypothetical protein
MNDTLGPCNLLQPSRLSDTLRVDSHPPPESQTDCRCRVAAYFLLRGQLSRVLMLHLFNRRNLLSAPVLHVGPKRLAWFSPSIRARTVGTGSPLIQGLKRTKEQLMVFLQSEHGGFEILLTRQLIAR